MRARRRLYVLTRFDNSIKIINTQTKTEIGGMAMYNPEPAHVVSGRRFLYDASFSSSHGDSACFELPYLRRHGSPRLESWQPGPAQRPRSECLCQRSLYPGLRLHERRHDHPELARHGQPGPHALARRSHGRALEPSAPPNSGHFNERLAFKAFNVAFPGLLGRDSQIPMPIWRRSRASSWR